jgi:hypothetical protein
MPENLPAPEESIKRLKDKKWLDDMKIIRCTKKLLKEAGIAVTDQPVSPSSWLESWHANLVIIDRSKCLLVTNDESFYTLFIPGLKKSDFKNLKLIINEHLFSKWRHEKLQSFRVSAHDQQYDAVKGVKIWDLPRSI